MIRLRGPSGPVAPWTLIIPCDRAAAVTVLVSTDRGPALSRRVIEAAAKTISRAQSELVVPGSQPSGFERPSQRPNELILVLPRMGTKTSNSAALSVATADAVGWRAGGVRPGRGAIWKLVGGGKQFWLGPARAGTVIRFWADTQLIHLSADGCPLQDPALSPVGGRPGQPRRSWRRPRRAIPDCHPPKTARPGRLNGRSPVAA